MSFPYGGCIIYILQFGLPPHISSYFTSLSLLFFISFFPFASLPEVEVLGAVCQTAVSRETAYALIYQLCKSNQSNLARLVCIMNGDVGESVGEGRERGDGSERREVVTVSPPLSARGAMAIKDKGEKEKGERGDGEREEGAGERGVKRLVQWEYDPSDLVKVRTLHHIYTLVAVSLSYSFFSLLF